MYCTCGADEEEDSSADVPSTGKLSPARYRRRKKRGG